jgi:hypothetical protein
MRTLILFLVLCGVSFGAPTKAVPLDVKGDTVLVVRSFPITITAAAGAHSYQWSYPSAITAKRSRNVLTILNAPKGTHQIYVTSVTVDFDKKTVIEDEGDVSLVVGDVPGPGPVPPGPDPKPPVPVGDLKVLVVWDKKNEGKLPKEQQTIIYDKRVRDWFNANCGPDKDKVTASGKAGAIWPEGSDVSELPKPWQDAFKRTRPKLPYFHIFKGEVIAHEGELPANTDAFIKVLNDYVDKK